LVLQSSSFFGSLGSFFCQTVKPSRQQFWILLEASPKQQFLREHAQLPQWNSSQVHPQVNQPTELGEALGAESGQFPHTTNKQITDYNEKIKHNIIYPTLLAS